MTFEADAFISYAHLDDAEATGTTGWVTNLHRALEVRLAQLLGQKSNVWRDPKLQGNDIFDETLVQRLQRAAALISIVSPAYVKSAWCQREIAEFCKAAGEQRSTRVGSKSRIFKVLKTPVSLDKHPVELRNVLGYEFFKVDPDTGDVSEFDKIFGADAERAFWVKLYDLAQDIVRLLEKIESERVPDAPLGATTAVGTEDAKSTPADQRDGVQTKRPSSPARQPVYLAVTTAEIKEQREAIKRDLEQHGYTVLPDRPLRLLTADEVQAAIGEDLAQCQMSVHMIGRTYSLVPEGASESLIEIQNDLSKARAAQGAFSRLIWMAPGLQVDDERQRKVVEQLRMDPGMAGDTDLLETPLEDLRTMIAARLGAGKKPVREPAGPPPEPGTVPHVYVMCDQRDAASISPWVDFLFTDFEVILPCFEGDEAQVRDYHEENLRSCDGALVFHGAGNDFWLRQKLREVQKSLGYGRTKPMPVVGICLIAPRTPEKERWSKTHDAIVISQWDGFSPDPLQPFLVRLKGSRSTGHGDAAANAV